MLFTLIGQGSILLFTWLIAGGRMGGGGGVAMVAAVMFGGLLFSVVFVSIAAALTVVFWSILTHGLLMLSGGAPRGIGRTMQAIAYGAGANAAAGIPIIGLYLATMSWIWWGVSSSLMLSEVQRVSHTRAFVATFAPPALSVIVLIGLAVVGTGNTFSAVGPGFGFGDLKQSQRVNGVLIARMQAGELKHAVELIADGDLLPNDFVLADSQTFTSNSMIAGRSLDRYEQLTAISRSRVIQSALSEFPKDVTAYRVGDYVFTHSGIDIKANNGQMLWLTMTWPDPEAQFQVSPNYVMVSDARGNVLPIQVSRFPVKLSEQNQMRAKMGLPPIPHPSNVLHGSPASASDSGTLSPSNPATPANP